MVPEAAYVHVVATLAGGARKVVLNKSEDEVLSAIVVPFVSNGTLTTRWGSRPGPGPGSHPSVRVLVGVTIEVFAPHVPAAAL